MKQRISRALILLLLLSLMPRPGVAEAYTEYRFDEFTVRIPDRYLTYARSSATVVSDNDLYDASTMYGTTLDGMTDDESLRLVAYDVRKENLYHEIDIRIVPYDADFDFSAVTDMSEEERIAVAEQVGSMFTANGVGIGSFSLLDTPQTTFLVYDDMDFGTDQGHYTYYMTVANIGGTSYQIMVLAASATNPMPDAFRKDVERIVTTMDIAGYPDFDVEVAPVDGYRSAFVTPDGIPFGTDIEGVHVREARMGNANADIRAVIGYFILLSKAQYTTALEYDNIPCFFIDYSLKGYHFDEDDLLFALYYEFRTGYGMDLEGMDDLSFYEPAYQSVEAELTKRYGAPQFGDKDKSKCEINGHGMRRAFDSMDGGLDEEKLYGYSEWLLDDPAGKIKIEHIMWFTGHVYKHNLTFELIRD